MTTQYVRKSKFNIVYEILKNIFILALIIGIILVVFHYLDIYFAHIDQTTYKYENYFIDQDKKYHILISSKSREQFYEIVTSDLKANTITQITNSSSDVVHGTFDEESSKFTYRSKNYKCNILDETTLNNYYENLKIYNEGE